MPTHKENSQTPAEPIRPTSQFLRRVEAESGVAAGACYACKKCSNGCPLTFAMDLHPYQVVRYVQLGLADRLKDCHTIWLCAACETCATRCPNDIEIAGLMDVIREVALRKGVKPAEPRVPLFHKAFLKSISNWGRAYEIGMIGGYKLSSGDLFGDMKLGLNMFLKGKLICQSAKMAGKIKRWLTLVSCLVDQRASTLQSTTSHQTL